MRRNLKDERRNNHKLVLFPKLKYNKTPRYLAEFIKKKRMKTECQEKTIDFSHANDKLYHIKCIE